MESLNARRLSAPRWGLPGAPLACLKPTLGLPAVSCCFQGVCVRSKAPGGSVHRGPNCLSSGALCGVPRRRIFYVENPSITAWKLPGRAVYNAGGFCAQEASLPRSKKRVGIPVESSGQLGAHCRVIHREALDTNTVSAALSSDSSITYETNRPRYPRAAPVLKKTKNFKPLLEQTPVQAFRSVEEIVGT